MRANLGYCANGAHDCDSVATCENTRTGFKCTCPPEYSGDGRKCELKNFWKSEQWSQCSVTCGRGEMTRVVRCQKGQDFVSDSQCDQSTRPSTKVSCKAEDCVVLKPKWVYSNWSTCSQTCGTGQQTRQKHCETELGRPSDDCDRSDSTQLSKSCSLQLCPEWALSDWSKCSLSCGGGQKTRLARCQSGQQYVSDSQCDPMTKPSTSVACNTKSCPKPQWVYKNWSVCSKTCGTGEQTRERSCETESGVTSNDCDQSVSTQLSQSCNRQSCPEWKYDAWSPCSVSCDWGKKTRKVTCKTDINTVPDSQCNATTKPSSSTSCKTQTCPKPKWVYTSWSKCSKTCGSGVQTRERSCEFESGKSSSQCDRSDSTRLTQSCSTESCPGWHYGDWSDCSRSCGGGQKKR